MDGVEDGVYTVYDSRKGKQHKKEQEDERKQKMILLINACNN